MTSRPDVPVSVSDPPVPRIVQRPVTPPVGDDLGVGQGEGLAPPPVPVGDAGPVPAPVGLPPVVPVGLPAAVGLPVGEDVLVAVAVAVDVCCCNCAARAPAAAADPLVVEVPDGDPPGEPVEVAVPDGDPPGEPVEVGDGLADDVPVPAGPEGHGWAPTCAVESGTFRINMASEQTAMIVKTTRASVRDDVCTGSTPSVDTRPLGRDRT